MIRPALPRLQRCKATLIVGLSALAIGLAAGGSQPPARAASDQAIPAVGSPSHVGEAVSPSTPDQLALVEHLRRKGAVFYGAWWCPHCFTQKNLFGTEAGRLLPYVECDKDDAGRKRCLSAKVRAYPSWDLGGERREGVQSLEELKRWSGYDGNASTSQR
jgi:thiol-disulfide isomerase/thioredoxin